MNLNQAAPAQNPNAVIGGLGGGSGLGTLAVWLLNKYAHAGLDPAAGAAVAGVVAAVVLFIGREGVKGIVGLVWSGKKAAPKK